MTLDFCVAAPKESVCDSVKEKGCEEEPVPSEPSELCVTERPVKYKGMKKCALLNADPHLGPAHETTGPL